MAKIVVQKDTTQRSIKDPLRRVYATVCYYYPQYTLKEAEALPARDIELLLETANSVEQKNLFHLTRIETAPYTKDRKALSELQSEYLKGANR